MRKLIIAAAVLAPAVSFAGGYIIPDETARDLALSQSTVASQTGAGAIFLNPAALAGQEGFDISGSIEVLDNRTEWSDPGLGSSTLIRKPNTPPIGAVSYSHQFDNGMGVGVGVGFGVPAGGSLKWPNGWAGQEYIQSVDQKVYEMNAGAAFQPVPGVRIGAAFVRYQGTERLHQSINFLDHEGDGDLGLSGGANSYELAAEIKIPRIPVRIGAAFNAKAKPEIKGDVHFTGVPPQFSTLLHDQKVSEELAIPSVLVVGAAVDVTHELTLTGSFTEENWSIYHADQYIGADGFTVTVPRNYNNAQVYRVGAEWLMPFFRPLTIRAGGLRSISKQPSDTVSPTLTDGKSWAFSAGLGVNVIPELRIDFGYQKAYFDPVTASGTETLPGQYNTVVNLYSFGLDFRTDFGMHRK